MSFIQNSLTRRTVVQAIYRNHFLEAEEFFLEDDFILEKTGNQDLYIKLMKKCFFLWPFYKNFFKFLCFEEEQRTLIEVSILKTFISELLIQETDNNILFKEYLNIANAFCNEEVSVLKVCFNKCVEENIKSKEEDFIHLD
ncbi:hypothetical protein [Alphaproteobacteria bacterium endosymbiont of Tiliacea citrago]|uniref:hypothetical protein n=1 Tax=Alphaproteobacteria bacterium endosymbiont of Tiliacea citrago TaxID=3077944 RepID=UPI00313B092B